MNSRCFQHEKCHVLTVIVVSPAIQKMYLLIIAGSCYGDNCKTDLEGRKQMYLAQMRVGSVSIKSMNGKITKR